MNLVRTGVVLFVIDPQNDFMGNWDGSPYTALEKAGAALKPVFAALPVKGAADAMDRFAVYVDSDAGGAGIDDVVVTLDTHAEHDVGHPAYWRGRDGEQPLPMTTIITLEDVERGKWAPANPQKLERVRAYLAHVGAQVVWNTHCVDGTWGHRVYAPLAEAFKRWEERSGKRVHYVRKGMNPDTEQYGIFEAAKPDSRDPRTQYNWYLLDRLRNNYRQKKVAGIATDFCVKASMEQAVAKLSCGEAKEFALLIEAMAAVDLDGTGAAAADFIADMQRKGVAVESFRRTLT